MTPHFEKIPYDLLMDSNVTMQARLLYPVLLALAWQRGAKVDEQVELPAIREIALTAGCGERALRDYLTELRATGWITTTRAARGRPQLYTIHSARAAESAAHVRQNPPHSRAQGMGETSDLRPDGETNAEALPSRERRPSKARPRNIVYDELARVCGIDPALLDSKTARFDRDLARETGVAQAAIRAKCAGDTDEQIRLQVQLRATLYRRLWPEITLTPSALAKHWNRVATTQVQPGRARCPVCGVTLPQGTTLADHLERQHPDHNGHEEVA